MIKQATKLSRGFCSKLKPPTKLKALLVPSKLTVFPFQTHIRVISESDGDTLKKLGFNKAISSIENKYLHTIHEDHLEFIESSKRQASSLIRKS